MIKYGGNVYKDINAYAYIDKNGLGHGKANLESCIEYTAEYGRDILPDGMRGTLAEFKQAIADFESSHPEAIIRIKNGLKNNHSESTESSND